VGGIKIVHKIIFGQMGLQKITSAVAMIWKGKVTCREYKFTKEQLTLWVDKRDAKDMLARKKPDGGNLFTW